MKIKDYVAKQIIGKRLHFECDCLFPIDFIGTVRSYRIVDGEIIFQVDRGEGKLIDIGLNHPKMDVTVID